MEREYMDKIATTGVARLVRDVILLHVFQLEDYSKLSPDTIL